VASEIFVDASAWIAIINRRDEHHAAAIALYERLLRERRPLVTTNLVIAEAYVMIRRHTGYQPAIGFLDSIRQTSRLLKVYSDATLEAEAEEILRRYADQDFSLADAVSFVVMRRRKITEAFAFDSHFVTADFVVVPAA
jgi:predicted nucleic acid-binding protein